MKRAADNSPDRPLATALVAVAVMVALSYLAWREQKRPKAQRRTWLLVLLCVAFFAAGAFLVGWRWAAFFALLESFDSS